MTIAATEPPTSLAKENDRRIQQRDTRPMLFRPITFRSVTARNRIVMSPMCQYSAIEGVPTDWHIVHLGSRAVAGCGIVFVEATGVEARGRITPSCTGIWNDTQRDAFARIAKFIAAQGSVPAIQLAHAGRKASVNRPWEGTKPIGPEQGGWPTIGPSALAWGNYAVPRAMEQSDIDTVVAAFAAAARRAREAGFRLIEVHGAHGYLIQEFLSPLSNKRTDRYGGSLENRARLLMQVLDAVRREWPAELPLFLRISSTDWIEGGWTLADSILLAKLVRARGDVDLIDCSSGGNDPAQKVPANPGYQTPFAEAIRREAGIATGAVGLISSPEQAEEILANGRADLVFLARALLHDAYWPMHAAKALKAEHAWAPQYERGNIF
jgi:2,4-dienoyl-CoA reductase-like NADH-dependent reductase (Old Yellow Enzyme family)